MKFQAKHLISKLSSHHIYSIIIIITLLGNDPVSSGTNQDTTANHYWSMLETSYWSVTIPVWIPGYRGQFAIGDVVIEGDTKGDNIFDRLFNRDYVLEFYFVGRVQYFRSNWMAQIDFFRGELDKSISFKNKEGELFYSSIQMTIPRIIAGYKIANWDNLTETISNLNISIYSGMRYLDVAIKTKPANKEEQISLQTSWWDPIIGA